MEELNDGVNEENIKIDLLDRQNFVERVIDIIEKLSSQEKNMCYAINGKWGVGKSFVLEMLERRIKAIQKEGNITDKYLVFHYDCWKYDFYEEPVVAIVASMMDEIDKNVNFLPEHKTEVIKGVLKAVGSGVLLKINDTIEENINVDVKKIWNVIKNGTEEVATELEKSHEYDTYFAFKNILSRLQKTITSLAENQTIVFVVDELDRCLPEYMIKVLERLHHIFDGISNVQVLLSIDKEQIRHAVEQIYGESTDVDKYLAKFINFAINLDVGDLSGEYKDRYNYYFSKFEYLNEATIDCEVQDFLKYILCGIDMRSRIEIINKCDLLHNILWSEAKSDYSFMCLEIFFAVLKYWKVDMDIAKTYFNRDKLFEYKKEREVYTGLDYLCSRYAHEEKRGIMFYIKTERYECVRRDNIWALLFASYRYILGFTRDTIDYDNYKNQGIRKYCNEYWNLLHLIN